MEKRRGNTRAKEGWEREGCNEKEENGGGKGEEERNID